MGRPTLGFIGAGKVGNPLARLWYASGYTVKAIYSRNLVSAHVLAERVKAEAVLMPAEVVQTADLTLLAIPDDALTNMAANLGQDDWSGKAVIHTSGVYGADILSSLTQCGAKVGSLHPAFPFADTETAMATIAGAVFAVEAEDAVLRGWLTGMVEALKGQVLAIPAGQKALYHSALVFASSYAITLYAIAERLLMEIGAEREIADQTLNNMMRGVVENLREKGIPDALTGPLVRGDARTIAAHLEALAKTPYADLYRTLVRQTYPLLAARRVEIDSIEQILRQSEHHAPDDS